MFSEYDAVVLKKPLPKNAGLRPDSTVPVGSRGSIVGVESSEEQAYLVEFFDENNETIDVFEVVGDEYLELTWTYREEK